MYKGLQKSPHIPCPTQRPPTPPPFHSVMFACTRKEWIKAISDGKISANTKSFFFITDTQEFYWGMTRYGVGSTDGGLSIVPGLPTASSAQEGTLYFNTKDKQFYVFTGGQFVNCLPIDTSDKDALSKLSTDLRVPSSKNVFRFVSRNIKALYARVKTAQSEAIDRISDLEKNMTYILDDIGLLNKLKSLDTFRRAASARLLVLTKSMDEYASRTRTLEEKVSSDANRIAQMQRDIEALQVALRGHEDLRAEFDEKIDALDKKVNKLTAIDPSEDNLLRRTANGLIAVQNWYEVSVSKPEQP